MTLTEQVFAQALLLAGELDERKGKLLRVFCGAAVSSLESRLRDGLTPEDCKEDFLAAASLYALAALGDTEEAVQVEEFQAGDLSVRKSGDTRESASRSLERQAEKLMLPYLKDRFSFTGV